MEGKKRYSQAQNRATQRYIRENLEEIKLRFKKGKKDIIRKHAEIYDQGSMNAFINRAIDETMQRDKEKG